jgi:hypothetical protein
VTESVPLTLSIINCWEVGDGCVREKVKADAAVGVSRRKGESRGEGAGAHMRSSDNRLIVEWLLQTRPRWSRSVRQFVVDLLIGKLLKLKDVRYNLAEVLQSKAVRDAFDVVILDCPPRLTTSTAQALCAGSHLLIPTILDKPCAEAVVTFCEEVELLRKTGICPMLKYVGVVGMRVSSGADEVAERDAKQMIRDALGKKNLPTVLLAESNGNLEEYVNLRVLGSV